MRWKTVKSLWNELWLNAAQILQSRWGAVRGNMALCLSGWRLGKSLRGPHAPAVFLPPILQSLAPKKARCDKKKNKKKNTRGRKIERKLCSWSTKLFSFAHIFSLFPNVLEVLFKENAAGMRMGGGGVDVLPGILSLGCRVLESEVYLESAEARLPTPPTALPFHSCTHAHAAHLRTLAIGSQCTVYRPTEVNTSK